METDQFHETMSLDEQNGGTEDVEMSMKEHLIKP